MFSVLIEFPNGSSYSVKQLPTLTGAVLEAECLLEASSNTLTVVVFHNEETMWSSGFNYKARQALHDRMDHAVRINSATTGIIPRIGIDMFDICGCIDAPEYIPAGSTESYQNFNGWMAIASTTFRKLR